MDALGLILAIGLGVIELGIAWPLILLPLRAEKMIAAPGCAPAISLLILVPMTLINTGAFLFLKAEGSFIQKFGLCFGGTTLFGICLLLAGVRASNTRGALQMPIFRGLAAGGLLANFYFLILLGRPGPGPTLTIDPGNALVLSILGLPVALICLAILSTRRNKPSQPPEPTVGEIHYLPPQ